MKKLLMTAALVLAASSVNAATYQVEMRNKGDDGVMVFQPSFVRAQPGDVIEFVPVDKGHNVESIKGMLPDGVEPFKTPFNKAFDLTVTKEGVYGVKCNPHYSMGMVALIEVGAPVNLDAAKAVKHPGRAGKHFDALFGKVQ